MHGVYRSILLLYFLLHTRLWHYHSVIIFNISCCCNHRDKLFCPTIPFPNVPLYCGFRTQVAVLHFNENSERPLARGKDGELMFRRRLVKTKKDAEVVSAVKTKAAYSK